MARDQWVKTGVRWRFEPTARGGRGARRRGIAERQSALAGVPLFAGLPARSLRSIARVSGIVEHPAGATVVREGARGAVFYAILDGRVRVLRRGRTIARLKRGQFFGELSLLDGQPRNASVEAETDATFLTLSKVDFRKVLDSDPRIAVRLLEVLAGRVRSQERPPAD